MPRISLIPSTIAFGDRGVEVAQPILQNAMQLADTFTTELPKIRMAKEAVAEDKRRYEDADFARSFGDINTLMSPDTVDLNDDGQGDLVAGKGGSIPRIAMGRTGKAVAEAEDPAVAADRVFAGKQAAYDKARQSAVAKLTTKDLTGKMVVPSDASVDEYLGKQGVARPEAPSPVDTTAESPFGSPANYGLGEGESNEDGTAGTTGMPRMVMSDMRRVQALQRLDSLKAADPSGERRLRHGLPNDQQIELLKMQLMGDKYPGMQDVTPSALPSETKQAAELATGLAGEGGGAEEQGPGEATETSAAEAAEGEAPTAIPPVPLRMSLPASPAPAAANGNDLAMHNWNLATGGHVDPRVADQVRSDVEHASSILLNHPDDTVRARGAEVQQALKKAIAMGDFALVARLRNALGRLGVFQPTAPAPVAPPAEVQTMDPALSRAIIARMGQPGQ